MVVKNEFGRAMIEMIAVLVIIGVLSITGMVGYKYASDKMHANEIIMNMCKTNQLPDFSEKYHFIIVDNVKYPIEKYYKSF